MLMFVLNTGLCFDGVISKLYTKRYINALVRVEVSDSTGNTIHQARTYEKNSAVPSGQSLLGLSRSRFLLAASRRTVSMLHIFNSDSGCTVYIQMKVRQSRYRPRRAQRVPGS